MKTEDAISILEGIEKTTGNANVTKVPLQMAIEALKGRVPIKKLFNGVDTYTCPRCGEEVYDEEYCKYCGQKILVE